MLEVIPPSPLHWALCTKTRMFSFLIFTLASKVMDDVGRSAEHVLAVLRSDAPLRAPELAQIGTACSSGVCYHSQVLRAVSC